MEPGRTESTSTITTDTGNDVGTDINTGTGTDIGIVAIGRNEGDRLRVCLSAAVATAGAAVVYVDSGSTDESVALARSLGAHVVELDLTKPFTAARARNEGFARLIQVRPDAQFVQFIDGDCELRPGWVELAAKSLEEDSSLAVVCGRRRERYPEASIYNRLCDMEWNTPIGRAKSSGGDAMIRVSAFQQVGGYNASVIAGEEPEMCVRLRAAGWQILRIDAEMTLHDAAMTSVGQWWKRNFRAGHAYAEGNDRHGRPPERFAEKQVRSNRLWGPLLLFPFIWPLHSLMAGKVALSRRRSHRDPLSHCLLYGVATVLGKAPQWLGGRKYTSNKRAGRSSEIIEYKSTDNAK